MMKTSIFQSLKSNIPQNSSKTNQKKILEAFSALLHQRRQDQTSNKVSNSLKNHSLLDIMGKDTKKRLTDKDNFQIPQKFVIKLPYREQDEINSDQKGIDSQFNIDNDSLGLGNDSQLQFQEKKCFKQNQLQSLQREQEQQKPELCKFVIRIRQAKSEEQQQSQPQKKNKKFHKGQTKIDSEINILKQKKSVIAQKTKRILQGEKIQILPFRIRLKVIDDPQNLKPCPENNPGLQKATEVITYSPLAYNQSNTQDSPQVQIVNVNKVYPWKTGKASLQQLVEEIYAKKLINQKLYKQFIQNHSPQDIKQYLQKFYSGRLHKFDFQKIKFTILDHRRFSQLLINLFPGEYEIGKVIHMDGQINTFLNKLYQMTGEEYYNLYAKIDRISKIKWWSKILICQEEKLKENKKEKMIAQSKAEKAQLAVQQLLKQFRSKLPSPFSSNPKKNYSLDDTENIQNDRRKKIKFN